MIGDLGAVAQLGERDVRNVEVRGSIPLGSTTKRRGFAAAFTFASMFGFAVMMFPDATLG